MDLVCDVSMFPTPNSIKLNEIYEYFIFNQGHNLTCSISAAISLIEYLRQKEGKKCEKFSVDFVYHEIIKSGCNYKNGLKASFVINTLLKHGSCLEKNYKCSDENVIEALERIKECKIESIEKSIETIKYVIGFCERPIVALMNIYDIEIFTSIENSYNLIDTPKNKKIYNKHTVLLTGYDDELREIYFQNSYGEEWGEKGFGRISYDFVNYLIMLYSMDESCLKSQEL